ncbi:MAG TPA: cadherin-like beta sandwich domain-containing protein [Clostridiales bacterium]|nr:cadherin-like beta sandwich domain-containing protein [Clostridiales bacterium]
MKKRTLFLFLGVALLCSFLPSLGALAENHFTSAPATEITEGEAFGYQIDLTALPEEIKAAPYTVIISGSPMIKAVAFEGELQPTYDQEKNVYTVTSEQLNGVTTLKVNISFSEAAVAGQQLTVTTAVKGAEGEPVSEDLLVTVKAAATTPPEEGTDQGDEGEGVSGDGGFAVTGGGGDVGGSSVYAGSADNYLKSLAVTGMDLSPAFHKTNDTYFLTVDANTDAISVSAKANDAKAKVVTAGNTSLSSGLHKVLISVTAENGEVRYYRIYVTKEAN